METDARRRGPIPPVFFLLALLAAIALDKYLPLLEVIYLPWNYAGMLFVAVGLAIAIVSAGAFARAGTPIRPFQDTTTLVTHGCYRFTRNPMYLGMFLVLLGVVVSLGSITPFIVLPFFVTVIQLRFIVHEEALLEKQFGEKYLDFKKRVRRWI